MHIYLRPEIFFCRHGNSEKIIQMDRSAQELSYHTIGWKIRLFLSALQPFQIFFLFVIHENRCVIMRGSFTLTFRMHIIIWLNNFDHRNMTILGK